MKFLNSPLTLLSSINSNYYFTLFSLIFLVSSFFGCGSVEDQRLENPSTLNINGISAAPLSDDVVLENMYEAEVSQLSDKTPVQIVTVLEGTSRVVLEARFRGIRDAGFGFPLYECELVDDAAEAMGGIAKGMSGSPVGPPGRVMGALAYGDDFSKSPTRFWVTAIDAMEASISHQTNADLLEKQLAPQAPSAKINSTYTPVKTPLMVTGVQAHRLQQLESHLEGNRFEFLELFANMGNAVVPVPADATTDLAAGDMIGVAVATGDVVNVIGYGTVTQVYADGTFVAFGHPMFAEGKSALPVYRAVGNGIVPNLQASYKSAAIYGNPIGTITKDLHPAIVGELGSLPTMVPVKIVYHAGTGEVIEKHHKVARGKEAYISAIVALTTDALRKEISPRTVDTTFTLHFEETEKTFTKSTRNTAADAFELLNDIHAAIGQFIYILSNNAGRATLRRVDITIKDTPAIKRAAIHKVIAPETVISGESATFQIVLLPHWSATENGRTLTKDVTIDIPQDFTGKARLQVSAAYVDDGFFFSDFDEEETPLPEHLKQLIEQIEAEQIAPGTITITLYPPSEFGFSDFSDVFPLELPPIFGEDEALPDEGTPPDELTETDELETTEDSEPAEPIETEIIIDKFIVTGNKEIQIDIVDANDSNGTDE